MASQHLTMRACSDTSCEWRDFQEECDIGDVEHRARGVNMSAIEKADDDANPNKTLTPMDTILLTKAALRAERFCGNRKYYRDRKELASRD